jgi:hypothetical protein
MIVSMHRLSLAQKLIQARLFRCHSRAHMDRIDKLAACLSSAAPSNGQGNIRTALSKVVQ